MRIAAYGNALSFRAFSTCSKPLARFEASIKRKLLEAGTHL